MSEAQFVILLNNTVFYFIKFHMHTVHTVFYILFTSNN